MNTKQMTATRLRLVLIMCMALLTAIGVGIFIFGQGVVAKYAVDVQQTATQARQSSSELEQLKATKVLLDKRRDTFDKTTQLTSETKSYVYQDRIVTDITQYANDAGLSVTNFSFTDPKATVAATNAAPAAASATAPTAQPAAIKSRVATFTIVSPVDYYKMLNFIHSIEQGVFRMRVATVGLSRGADNNLTSDVITIEVYVR